MITYEYKFRVAYSDTDRMGTVHHSNYAKYYERARWELLRNIDRFRKLNVLLMLGVSRKRFIGEFLNIKEPKNRDFATNIIHALLYEKQIEVIRVHNVERAIEMRKIAEHLQNVSPYQT